MPILFNPSRKKGVFMIPSGGTKSPTPTPPSFNNTKSLLFDGVDEYVDLGTSVNLGTVSTISLWIKHDGGGTTSQTIIGENSYSFDYLLAINWSLPRVYVRFSAGYYAWDGTPIDDTDWHNIIIVRDTTTTAKIYFDGVDQGAPDLSGGTFSGNTLFRYLGNNYPSNTQYFSGNIDEVAGWNSALTTDNINDISSTPTDLTSLNPNIWYRMGDNSTYKLPQILMPENSNKDKVSNYSFSFDGVDDYVDISATATLSGKAIISLSVWIKPDNLTGSNERIFDENTSTTGYTRFGLERDTDTIQMKWRDSANDPSGTAGTLTTGSVLTAGVWVHILAIYDSSSNEQKIYIDGSLSTSSSVSISTLGTSTTHGINIGRNPSASSYFQSAIDELAIWETNQSANALAIFNGGTPTTITGATAYWKLGEEDKFTDNWLVPNSALSNYSKFSFAFDGVDDYLSIANDTTIARTQNISYSIWINLTANTRQYLVGNWNSSNGGTGISIETGDVLVFQLADGTNDSFFNSRVASFSTYAPSGSWHHILGTFDGTDAKIYINGILRNTWTPTAPYTISGWNPFRIGWRGAGLTLLTIGKLDEIGLFDSAINLSDVWDGSGEPKDITAVSGIVSNWRMGEDASFNTNWTIPDQIGSNDAESTNMTIRDLKGEAPNYSGSGISNAMTIEDRVGDAPNSDNNAVSFNMESTDIDNNTP